MTRRGKIGRLPRVIREELNRRLEDGESGRRLVAWLNSLPETKRVLAREFGGRVINGQNLSEWRRGGFQMWNGQREMVSQVQTLTADAKELERASSGELANHLSTVLAARYGKLLLDWDGKMTKEMGREMRALRGLCLDVVRLRRGEHSAARLELERKRCERQRVRKEEEIVNYFKRWAQNEQVREWIMNSEMSAEERNESAGKMFEVNEE